MGGRYSFHSRSILAVISGAMPTLRAVSASDARRPLVALALVRAHRLWTTAFVAKRSHVSTEPSRGNGRPRLPPEPRCFEMHGCRNGPPLDSGCLQRPLAGRRVGQDTSSNHKTDLG
jgi:hypothetical protein